MRKTRLCITLILLMSVCYGQQFHIGIGGGFASYLGDLQIKPFLINTSDPGMAIQAGYAINSTFTLRAGFNAGQVSAADRNNSPDLRFRNLSFESWISELNLLLEISPVSLINGRFTPYAFGGIAVFRYNPYTTDLSGNKVYLQPLSTEGQGLPEYPYRKTYRLTQPSLPLGGGIKIAISPILTFALETGYRKTFTDYIDDVSTTFIDAQVLQNRKGTQAVDLAFRTDELPNASGGYPGSGSQRGDPRFNDWYTFYTTSLRISLPQKGPRSCSCPRVR